jgi:uncharacterized membrane protein
MVSQFKRNFFAGLVIFIPLSLTIYFFHLFFLMMSDFLHPIILNQHWIPLPRAIVRPLSFCLTIFLIWGLGLVASNFMGKRLVGWFEAGIRHIPFFRGIYEAIQKMTEAFFGTQSLYQSVVLVEYPRKGMHTFGFVTNRLGGAAFGSSEKRLCLFVPTVPNPTSGLLVYVPESETITLHMTIEEAVKILVSHGFVTLPEGATKFSQVSQVSQV